MYALKKKHPLGAFFLLVSGLFRVLPDTVSGDVKHANPCGSRAVEDVSGVSGNLGVLG